MIGLGLWLAERRKLFLFLEATRGRNCIVARLLPLLVCAGAARVRTETRLKSLQAPGQFCNLLG